MPRKITSAIRDGDFGAVLEASEARFAPMWKQIASQSQARHRKRGKDEDDVCQDTLIALHDRLVSQETHPDHRQLKSTSDVQRWSNRVARNKAIDASRSENNMRGPSSLHVAPSCESLETGSMDHLPGCQRTPENEAISSEAYSGALELEGQLLGMLTEWSTAIENWNAELSEIDAEIVCRHLNGVGISKIARELSSTTKGSVTHHHVRKTVRIFVDTMRPRVEAFRQILMQIEIENPGVAQRVSFPKNTAEYLSKWKWTL